MKSRLLWPVLAIALLLVCAAAVYVVFPADPVTHTNANRIKKGMSEEDIRVMLGRQPDDRVEVFEKGPHGRRGMQLVWEGDAGRIDVVVFENRVDTVRFSASPPPPRRQGFLETLREWVGGR